ncbi:hypothetical protein [Hyphomonas chukchiensis]|uniref:UrcA family protein n=1 Tax=Hyphomonas chukchiensis TaxID=1280947 RepID=A0A062UN16_9PROT|nr:hypothetical protein [Hyphomonas chukchiensis]KCZ60617.1 hypothetical protein HY30_11635 [Hyphomonas chukchiensis]
MPSLFKTLIAASALVALTGAASADETFIADFEFTPDAPVDVTYANFEKTAKKACRVESRMVGGIAARVQIEKLCREHLMTDAVAATKMDALIAYHEGRTLPETKLELASRN